MEKCQQREAIRVPSLFLAFKLGQGISPDGGEVQTTSPSGPHLRGPPVPGQVAPSQVLHKAAMKPPGSSSGLLSPSIADVWGQMRLRWRELLWALQNPQKHLSRHSPDARSSPPKGVTAENISSLCQMFPEARSPLVPVGNHSSSSPGSRESPLSLTPASPDCRTTNATFFLRQCSILNTCDKDWLS